MDSPHPEQKGSDSDTRKAVEPRIVDALQLFGRSREVILELAGVRYRLRITLRNKLILQK